MRHPFTLVTGDSDLAVDSAHIPEAVLLQLLQHPLLIAWHAQNRVFEHPKLNSIPIGLDYHTISIRSQKPHGWGEVRSPLDQERLLRAIARTGGLLSNKKLAAFSNWHFHPARGNRERCLKEADSKAVYYQSTFLPRDKSWQLNAQFAFTLSPFGAGLDCHRTWEAMLLGSVPIVMRSSLDSLYEGLPVVIVDDWREVTPQRLASEMTRVTATKFDFSRLELAYWTAKVKRQPTREGKPMTIDEFVQCAQ